MKPLVGALGLVVSAALAAAPAAAQGAQDLKVFQVGSFILLAGKPVTEKGPFPRQFELAAFPIGRRNPPVAVGGYGIDCAKPAGAVFEHELISSDGSEATVLDVDGALMKGLEVLPGAATLQRYACGGAPPGLLLAEAPTDPGALYQYANAYYGRIPLAGHQKGGLELADLQRAARCLADMKRVAAGSDKMLAGVAEQVGARWDFVRLGLKVKFGHPLVQGLVDAGKPTDTAAIRAVETCAQEFKDTLSRM